MTEDESKTATIDLNARSMPGDAAALTDTDLDEVTGGGSKGATTKQPDPKKEPYLKVELQTISISG